MSGITRDDLKALRIDWPSLQPVGGLASEPYVGAFVIQIKNGGGHDNHRIFIDIREGLQRMPVAYHLNPKSTKARYIIQGGTSAAHYDRSQRNLPGTNTPAHWICQGGFESIYLAIESTVGARIGAFLNHIASVLNS